MQGKPVNLEGWTVLDFRQDSPHPITMISTHAGIIPDKASPVAGTNPKAGIFADEMPQNIITRVVNYALDLVLLCGDESDILINNLQKTICPDLREGVQIIKVSCKQL